MPFVLICVSSATFVPPQVFYSLYEDGRINAKLDFQFVSFALVFPVVFFVGETYKRREAALAQLATVKYAESVKFAGFDRFAWHLVLLGRQANSGSVLVMPCETRLAHAHRAV